MGSAGVLRGAACGLQVPHGRAEAAEGVTGRESVAVPYDVGEGADVTSALAAAAPGDGQALRAAKSPIPRQ